MPSTRKPGLPTCWTSSPITPSHGSISCCPGIGKASVKQSSPDRQLTAVLVGCLPIGCEGADHAQRRCDTTRAAGNRGGYWRCWLSEDNSCQEPYRLR